ncbi:histidine kinase [Saccharothrix sp. ST-888]|uniref:histidine kinase n=1 Tax=Saccharothrix sp. ST-888 TaxID=1427391 RepID=UPI000A93FAD9|nr:histidine kinase [Saccharothrix sp. ST-888]
MRGVLMLARATGAPLFDGDESGPLLGFAGQAALAMELAERRRESEQIVLLKERDRIARDLHDLAIQRLLATGMTLQGALRFIDHPEAADRVLRAIDDLDETARTIRATIFGLRIREAGPAAKGLRARVVEVVERAAAVLGQSSRVSWQPSQDANFQTARVGSPSSPTSQLPYREQGL